MCGCHGLLRCALEELADLRAIILNDNPHVQQIITLVLKSLGVRDQTCVETREAALAACAGEEPDVVILDAVLDGAEAFDFIRRLRDKERSFNAYVPIIVATGHTQLKIVRGAINAGAHEFVSFPISPSSLAKRLYSAVFMGRPFVTAEDYFGPDRRRYVDPKYAGPERRAGADAEAAQAKLAARAAAEAKFADKVGGA